jgi:hypothetical protein
MINPKTKEELDIEFKENFINEVRQERNKRIAETDYIYMPDVNVLEDYKTAMNTYRQELRDIPDIVEEWLVGKDLYSVSVWGVPWPEKPN